MVLRGEHFLYDRRPAERDRGLNTHAYKKQFSKRPHIVLEISERVHGSSFLCINTRGLHQTQLKSAIWVHRWV